MMMMMNTFVTRNLNCPQMRRCYIIELVQKVLSLRANVWMDDVSLSSIRLTCIRLLLITTRQVSLPTLIHPVLDTIAVEDNQ